MILDPELPTQLSPSRSKKTIQFSRLEQYFFSFKIMPREKNTPDPETVQLSAGSHYMGDTHLPEYTYTARRSSQSHNDQLLRRCVTVLHHNPPTILPFSLHLRGYLTGRPLTIYLRLGSRCPQHQILKKVHFRKSDSMMFQKRSRQSQE